MHEQVRRYHNINKNIVETKRQHPRARYTSNLWSILALLEQLRQVNSTYL